MSLLEYIAKLLINKSKFSLPWPIVFKTVFTNPVLGTDPRGSCSHDAELISDTNKKVY
jgi:hypothetical protein